MIKGEIFQNQDLGETYYHFHNREADNQIDAAGRLDQ